MLRPPWRSTRTPSARSPAQGLDLSEAELAGLLPLVLATRALLDELATAPLDDLEPTAVYHVL